MKFTQSNVHSLRPPAGRTDHTEWDEALPKFCIRFRNMRGAAMGSSLSMMTWISARAQISASLADAPSSIRGKVC